ncbi:MAG: PAS domain-containing sensor histidine kinase, partial [Polyangiales bacterium]
VERALERLERQQGDNERALADASNRLQALIDSMADGCVTLNARGELRSINAAARQIFMVQDEADWRGLALTALIPGLTEGMQAPADDMTALLTALLDRGSFETEGRRLSGSACALELSLTRGVLAGEVIYTAIVRDISERKRLEAERRRAQQSAERYRRLFVHSQSMPAIASFDGYFQEINATWSQVLGFREPVLRARPFYALVHPDDRPAVQAAIAQLIRGEVERIRFSHRCRTAHGEDRWLSWNTSVDHHEQRLYAVAHDITELVLTRERLRHKEQLLQQSARIARVGGWVMSLADQRLQWSDEVFRIHELPIGPSPSLAAALRFYPDQAAAQLREAIDTAIRDGKPWDLELPFTTAQGRRLWVRAKGEPEREGGQVVRLRGTFQDISRQKEIARMKDEFVSMVSHELRTPLTSILGSLRLLETGVAGTLSERVAGLVHIATGNAQRLVRLVSDILDLDKMGAGKLELRLSQRELDDVIRKAIKSIDAVALQAQVHIRCDLAVFPTLLLDEDRITQVLVNLLSNAIKFSPPEGVVRIDVEAWPEKVRVSVRDQGPGIAAEDISKLFTPFQQLDTSDARAKGGTGLGLAISKGIVHKHGGHIGVNSEPGKGACFWFELPVRC